MVTHQQAEARALMKEILQDELLELRVESYRLSESFDPQGEPRFEIYMSVRDSTSGEILPIEGVGVGLVDAAFHGFAARFASEYESLKSITFSRFEAKGLMSSGSDDRADAEALIEIGITNSYGHEFTFQFRSRSLGHACVQGVAAAIQYFVNSERAFIRMYKARQHYQEEGRDDLVAKYTGLMAQMVKNTSYSDVLERIKKEMG